MSPTANVHLFACFWRATNPISLSDAERTIVEVAPTAATSGRTSPWPTGCPRAPAGISGISVSAADPGVVYAMIECIGGGVFRSDDAGATWGRSISELVPASARRERPRAPRRSGRRRSPLAQTPWASTAPTTAARPISASPSAPQRHPRRLDLRGLDPMQDDPGQRRGRQRQRDGTDAGTMAFRTTDLERTACPRTTRSRTACSAAESRTIRVGRHARFAAAAIERGRLGVHGRRASRPRSAAPRRPRRGLRRLLRRSRPLDGEPPTRAVPQRPPPTTPRR